MMTEYRQLPTNEGAAAKELRVELLRELDHGLGGIGR